MHQAANEIEALADDLAWYIDRHGLRADTEAEDAHLESELARVDELSDDDCKAELAAEGIDYEASRKRMDVLLRTLTERTLLRAKLTDTEADLAALRIEHALHVDLLAAARREREEARANHTAASTILAGWRAKAQTAERERDELRASLDNERGAGSGPSDGWAFDGKPAFAWAKRYGHRLVDITRDPRHGWRVVWWIVTPDGRVDGDSHEHRGTGPLVRDLMRAADAALAGSGS
jgi:hypothetical protein